MSRTPPRQWSLPLRRSRRLHGYLRVARDGRRSALVDPIRTRMVLYAEAAGLVLDEVCVDVDDEPGGVPSTAVSHLLATMRRRRSVGVVVPSLEHLAYSRHVGLAVKELIEYRSGVPVVTLSPRSPWPPGEDSDRGTARGRRERPRIAGGPVLRAGLPGARQLPARHDR